LREIELTDRSEFVSPGSVLQQRLVVAKNQLYVRKFVSRAAGSRNPHLYDLLDNEIRAGTRLAQVFPYTYPPQLAHLVAYNMDAEEPFVLLTAYSGEPAASPVSRFDDAQRRAFQIGLLRALQLTAAAGVVHGAVTMDAVRWDNGSLQLVDFESAERVGEPRRRGRSSPVRSPEQLEGTGVVDIHDDMWAAGLLIRGLYLGPLMDGSPPDRSHDPERLRALLGPVFDNPVERRPDPTALLGKLRADSRLPALTDPEAGLAEGRVLFEQISRAKGGPGAPETPDTRDSVAQPGRRPRRMLPFLATMVLVMVVIVGLAVLA
jgi:hypothetical protein